MTAASRAWWRASPPALGCKSAQKNPGAPHRPHAALVPSPRAAAGNSAATRAADPTAAAADGQSLRHGAMDHVERQRRTDSRTRGPRHGPRALKHRTTAAERWHLLSARGGDRRPPTMDRAARRHGAHRRRRLPQVARRARRWPLNPNAASLRGRNVQDSYYHPLDGNVRSSSASGSARRSCPWKAA